MAVGTVDKATRLAWLAVLALSGSMLVASSGWADRVFISQGAACDGLDEVGCCAQTTAVYAFRATGDQLSRRARLVVDLACNAESQRLPKHGCRQLLIGRGLSASEATATCENKGLAQRCAKQQGCAACAADLAKLGFSGAQGLCYAATWNEAGRRGYRR